MLHILILLHIPKNCPFNLYNKQFHVVTRIFSPSIPASTFHPTNSIFLRADTQSFSLLGWICPNHLNLLCPTTSSATLKIPRGLYKSSLHFLFLKNIPQSSHPSHHHNLCSGLSRLQIFCIYFSCFSPIFQHTLDTSCVHLSLDMIRCIYSCHNEK